MLSVEGVNQFYGSSQTLWDIRLNVPEGSCTVILGRNGAAKTTLLKCLMGTLPVQSGRILFNENEITRMPPYRRVWQGIGYVPQGREIFPGLTVEENLRIGLYSRADRQRKIPREIYTMFPALAKMPGRRGGDLSGGQQQQLAIGRALCTQPKVLLLDEPTEGIQPNLVREIGEVLISLHKEKKITILLVEQKLAFARKIGEYFCILDKGRVKASGKMSELDERLVHDHLAV